MVAAVKWHPVRLPPFRTTVVATLLDCTLLTVLRASLISRSVFFMQCGFGMLEAGSVTARQTTNILLKNLLDASVSAVVWYSVGFGLAFEGDNPIVGAIGSSGTDNSPSLFFSLKMLREDAEGFTTPRSASGYDWAFWWFQFVRAMRRAHTCPVESSSSRRGRRSAHRISHSHSCSPARAVCRLPCPALSPRD